MSTEEKVLAQSKQTAIKVIYATFLLIKEAGGELPRKEIYKKLPEKVNLTSWELETYSKTGNIRWQSILHFFSIDCIKAGYMRKDKGIWYLTPEGEKAIELGERKLLESATAKYREWAAINKEKKESSSENESESNIPIEIEDNISQLQKANLEQLEEQALTGIEEFIAAKNPYEFQDIVAALLRAMQYHTPFISPKGKDGGLDIVAYRDPLGAVEPRIKVQVKHKPEATIAVDDIRSLVGLLTNSGDIGLFVTSGSFSKDALRFARDSYKHVRLIDGKEFIELWKEFYNKLTDEEKNWIPLQQIFFLGSNE